MLILIGIKTDSLAFVLGLRRKHCPFLPELNGLADNVGIYSILSTHHFSNDGDLTQHWVPGLDASTPTETT